jgi:hypothetical protein
MLRCVVCGGMVTERDDLTAEGLRCAPCSMRSEIEGHERNIVEEAERKKQRGLYRRASWAAWAHSILWAVAAAFFCFNGAVRHDAWWWPLFAVVIGVRVALWLRQRWAFYLALGVDGALIATPFGWAVSRPQVTFGDAAVIAFFPLVFGLLLFSLRRAYAPESKRSPVPEPKPIQKWSDPGRQL